MCTSGIIYTVGDIFIWYKWSSFEFSRGLWSHLEETPAYIFVVQPLFVSRDSTDIVSCKHEAVNRLNLQLCMAEPVAPGTLLSFKNLSVAIVANPQYLKAGGYEQNYRQRATSITVSTPEPSVGLLSFNR